MHARPLVILTREPEDNAPLARLLAERGIEVLEYPCLATRILPYAGGPLCGHALEDFDVVAFSSKRGVAGFERMRGRLAARAPKIACVGEATAVEVSARLGLAADIVPHLQTSEGLADAVMRATAPGTRVLHVRGNKTTGALYETLAEAGWNVCETVVYENYAPDLAPLGLDRPAVAVFASPSAAEHFIAANPRLAAALRCVAIGPVTGAFLRNSGAARVVESGQPDAASLAEAVENIIKEGAWE